MSSKTGSTVDLLRRALDREFGEQPTSYVSFEANHLRLDLKGFLTSDVGREALKARIECASRVPIVGWHRLRKKTLGS